MSKTPFNILLLGRQTGKNEMNRAIFLDMLENPDKYEVINRPRREELPPPDLADIAMYGEEGVPQNRAERRAWNRRNSKNK